MVAFCARDSHLALFAVTNNGGNAVDLRYLCFALRHPGLEQLLDAREATGDIQAAGDAAEVERTHGELRTRLADRLCGDDPDRLADLN